MKNDFRIFQYLQSHIISTEHKPLPSPHLKKLFNKKNIRHLINTTITSASNSILFPKSRFTIKEKLNENIQLKKKE